MSSEAGTTGDEKVLKLQEELSQCRLEREDRLWAEKESFMIMKREIKELEDELRDEKEANSRATSVFNEQKKSLEEALNAMLQSIGEVEKALHEIQANHDGKNTEVVNANEELKKLNADIKERDESCLKDSDELDKLQSRIDEEWKNLIAFLQTYCKNSELTDGVKPLLQDHYDAYINTLQCGDDDYRMLNKYVRVVLQPSSAQKQMFAGVDFISPVSTAISNILNSSLFCNRNFTDRDSKGKHPVGERVYNESEHPGEASIGKKLWDFIVT